MKITLKRSLMAVLCVIGVSSFVACSDDDEKAISANGSYVGTMTYTMPEVPAPTADAPVAPVPEVVNFTISDNGIKIPNFPVKSLIMAVVGDEDVADDIVASIGEISYTIPSIQNTTSNSEIVLTMTPKELVINNVSTVVETVIVTVEAVGTGKYLESSKKINFTLKASGVKIQTGEGDPTALPGFAPITLSFEGTRN